MKGSSQIFDSINNSIHSDNSCSHCNSHNQIRNSNYNNKVTRIIIYNIEENLYNFYREESDQVNEFIFKGKKSRSTACKLAKKRASLHVYPRKFPKFQDNIFSSAPQNYCFCTVKFCKVIMNVCQILTGNVCKRF